MYLVQKLEVILNKSTEEAIKNEILPLVFISLESNSVAGQVMLYIGIITGSYYGHNRVITGS